MKDRKDTRFNELSVRKENREKNCDITCYNCHGRGHMAKHCRKPKEHLERRELIKERSGKRVSTNGKQQPTDGPIYSIRCIGRESHEILRLKVDISKEDNLLFLTDTGRISVSLREIN
jgi:hypothetical protein